ncbi:uncharacterized protein LOC108808519 [Raphanus sativus]|uniref:Uncharacterized protein LOC108808519 n=1 Tax=Raphanus sativus TaxID=3726 RepID=A0A6J0JKH2_RAPSA|nr:uncharacterized protein LOC108808519 [Raphanus sativus]
MTRAIKAARKWLAEQRVKTTTLKAPSPRPEPTPPNTTTLKSDAAWSAERKLAGLGWVIRENNTTSRRMSHCCYVSSPLAAEALALREAMADCVNRGTPNLHCQSDSLLLVNALKSGSLIAELHGIIADIISLSSAFDFFSISWIRRSNNKEADALAKQSLLNASVVITPVRGA